MRFEDDKLCLYYDGKRKRNSSSVYPGFESYLMLSSSISFYIDFKFSSKEVPVLQSILKQPTKFNQAEKDSQWDINKHNYIVIGSSFDTKLFT